MNSGRNKYTSTPTYGMQRRGFGKKQPEKKQTNAELDFTQKPTPDFGTQIPGAPDPFSGPQGIYNDPVLQQGSVPYQQSAVQAQPIGNPNTIPMPGMNGQDGMPMQGINSQPGIPPQGMGSINNFPPQTNGQNGFPAYSTGYDDQFNGMKQPLTGMPLPIANVSRQAQDMPIAGGRAQGYVPPTVTHAEQAMAGMPPQPNYAQQGTGFPNQTMPFTQPVYSAAPSPNPQGTPMMGTYPGYQNPNGGGGGKPPVPPSNRPPKPPMSIDNWLKMLLYIILPVVFVLCIALPDHSFDILRYLFMIACAASNGVMWYRQSFTSSLRTGVTIGYGLMCIVMIVMMTSGNNDIVNAGDKITAQPTVVVTDEPSAEALGYQPDQAPVTTAPVEVQPADTEAGQQLSAFMDNWMENRVEDMLNYVMPSWRQAQEDPAAELFVILFNRTPLEYSIETISGTDNDTSRSITMNATIDKNNGNDPVRYRFVILMDNEDSNWYVDPNTISTNDVDEDANATEVPDNLEAMFTMAPRMTVTPVPPDSTTLYYNADGGSYYHADPQCSAVNEKYLPMASFTYGELNQSPYNKLRPCLKCNAPMNSDD